VSDQHHTSLPFVIDVCSRFEPSQVRVAYDPAPRPTTPQLEELIAAEWERQTAIARQRDLMLFNGKLLRYVRHEVTIESLSHHCSNGHNSGTGHDCGAGVSPVSDHRPGARATGNTGTASESVGRERLHLTVGPTCYRDFVGTNLFNHHRLGEFSWDLFSNPIGTTATLLTRDGRICYGRRSTRVAYHAGHIHTFGGGLEERDKGPDGSIDPFTSLCRELVEELAIPRHELIDLCCVGLIRDKEIHQPELLFEARLDISAIELRRRWVSAEGKDEHDEIVSIEDQPEAVAPFIRTCGPIAPVAIGALFLHGRRRWGEDWFRQTSRVSP